MSYTTYLANYLAAGGTQSRTVTPTGGLILGGATTRIIGRVVPPTGGLVMGGAAPIKVGRAVAPVGGIIFGGAATVTGINLQNKIVAPSGGIIFGGAATIISHHIGTVISNWIIRARRRGRR